MRFSDKAWALRRCWKIKKKLVDKLNFYLRGKTLNNYRSVSPSKIVVPASFLLDYKMHVCYYLLQEIDASKRALVKVLYKIT